MYREAVEVLVMSSLLIASVEDVKYKRIHVYLPCIMCAFMLYYDLINNDRAWLDIVMDISPGMGIIVYAIAGRGKIGTGDGVIMCMIGISSGITVAVNVMFFAAVVSLIYFFLYNIAGKITGRSIMALELPFIPFITAVFMVIKFAFN